jgi:DNA polymerase IV
MQSACLLVPDFLVALARRDAPELRGRPVVIGGSPDEHAQVTACSREAAAAGVAIGTTLRRALALCPNAVFLPLKEALVADESGRILDHLQLYSPVVEVIAPGHVHFDVRGLARMTGIDDATYLRDLHEAVLSATGLPVRLAAGETVFAAHAAAIHDSRSRRPTGNPVLVPPGGEKTFLADLPVEVLPVSPLMHMRLRLFGIERLGRSPGSRSRRCRRSSDAKVHMPGSSLMAATIRE